MQSLEVSLDKKRLDLHCDNGGDPPKNSMPDREAVLRFFREFPAGNHEWEMTLQEKENFLNAIRFLKTHINSHDTELVCAAASAVGCGIPGGIFELLIDILKQDHDFIHFGLGLNELGWNNSSQEYLRYASMMCLNKRSFLGDSSSLIRAAAINHLCESIDAPEKAPDGQELCRKTAKKLNDEFASFQLDYLFLKFGGSFFIRPSVRYPESKAFGAVGRFMCLSFGLLICLPLAGFTGYWIGRFAQWRIRNFVFPNAEWWMTGFFIILALLSLIYAYPQWVKEEKLQKIQGRTKRDWPVPGNLKRLLKCRLPAEIKTIILLGQVDGLEAIVFPIPGDEIEYLSPAGQITHITHMKDMNLELSEALRQAVDFMIPCRKIVYPCPQTVTINIRYPDIGFLVMEERISAMQNGNTLVGEVFAIALPKLLAEIRQRQRASNSPESRHDC